jgi:phage antirepressor YoqD-like protein
MDNNQIQTILENSQLTITQLNNALGQLEEENKKLVKENETWNRVSSSDNWEEMRNISKKLAIKGYGPNITFKLLRSLGILRDGYGDVKNQPYQKYVDSGHFKVISQPYEYNGQPKVGSKTLVSHKGIDLIRKSIENDIRNKSE